MHFLVTGASGFVGQNLVRRLCESGHDVTALVRKTSNRKELEKIPGVRFAVGDVSTGEGLKEALDGVDCVHHVAGLTIGNLPDLMRANADGTKRLCEAMVALPKPPRLVYCSSASVGGPTVAGKPRREEDPPAPVSNYGRSKLGGEQAVRAFADRIPSVIVRPPVIYGPGDRTNMPPMLTMARLGVFLQPGLTRRYYSWLHVLDVCDGLIAAGLNGKTVRQDDPTAGVYYLSDDQEYTWTDLYNALSRALGKGKARVVPVPYTLGYAAAFAAEIRSRLTNSTSIVNLDKAREGSFEAWICSAQRARNELSFKPAFGLESGFQDTVQWYRKEGFV